MKKIFVASLFFASSCVAAGNEPIQDKTVPPKFDTYEACVARGNKILKTMPPRCVNEQGQHLVRGKK